MSTFVPGKRHLREALLFCFNLRKSAADGHRMLCEAYGGHAPSIKTCEYWFRRFKSGDFDTSDKARDGRPLQFQDAELEALLNQDSCQTQEELAETLGKYTMANKKDKHKKKHKKEKKKKKSKKSKKSKCQSDFSDSSSSSSVVSSKNEIEEKPSEKSDWGFLDTVLSNSYVSGKDKKEKSKRAELDKPGQSSRELNPYWKDGGCGLPPAETNRKLKNEERESSGSTSLHRESFSNLSKSFAQSEVLSDSRKLNFLKPGKSSNVELSKSTYRGNWKKKEYKEPEVVEDKKAENLGNNRDDVSPNTSKSFSNEDLNKLAAKLVKAEILGNTALVNKLKGELEAAKKAKESASSTKEESGTKEKVTVIVTDRVLKKPHLNKESNVPSKRRKVITHDLGQRTCYFPDDDKYSLKNLFEKEKEGHEQEILLPSKLAGKTPEEMDDMYLEAAASNKMQEKMEKIEKQREIKKAVVKHRTLEGCQWCIDNRNSTKHLIASTGSKCYLCLPEEESLVEGHCLIVPIQHEVSTMHLDEDVWNEIKSYQRVLTQMFLEQDQDVVFFENARSFNHFPHCVIHCVPLTKEMGDLAPIYFQKAISESETEWSNNKKIIDFRQKDLRRSLPKGLPYFAVTFGTSGGFAHIIEDEFLFKKNFAEEVLGNMLDLDHRKWRKPQKDNFRAQREKMLEFLKVWKKFEFNENSQDSESSSSD